MRRKQVYLDDAGERALKRLAARTNRSEASHLREALSRYLHDVRESATDDPLEGLIGLVDEEDGPIDVAENHDTYLYGNKGGGSS